MSAQNTPRKQALLKTREVYLRGMGSRVLRTYCGTWHHANGPSQDQGSKRIAQTQEQETITTVLGVL